MAFSSSTSTITVAIRPPSDPVRLASTATIDSLYQALRKEVLITANDINQALRNISIASTSSSTVDVFSDDFVMKLAILILTCPAPTGNEVEVKLRLNEKHQAIIDRAIARAGLINFPVFYLPEVVPDERSSIDNGEENPSQLCILLCLLLRGRLTIPSSNEVKMVGHFETDRLRRWIKEGNDIKKLVVAWTALDWFAKKKMDVAMCERTGDIFVCFEGTGFEFCMWAKDSSLEYVDFFAFLNLLHATLAIHSNESKHCVPFLSEQYVVHNNDVDRHFTATACVFNFYHYGIEDKMHQPDTRSAIPLDKHRYQSPIGNTSHTPAGTASQFAISIVYVGGEFNRQVPANDMLQRTRGRVFFKLKIKDGMDVKTIHDSFRGMMRRWLPNAEEKSIACFQDEICLHAVRHNWRANTIDLYHHEVKEEMKKLISESIGSVLLPPLISMVMDYVNFKTEELTTWRKWEDKKLAVLQSEKAEEKSYDAAVKHVLCTDPQRLRGRLSAAIIAKYERSDEPWKHQCARFLVAQEENKMDVIKRMAKAEDYLPAVTWLIHAFKVPNENGLAAFEVPDEHICLQLYLQAKKVLQAWLLERKGVSYEVIPIQLRARLFEEARDFIKSLREHKKQGSYVNALSFFLGGFLWWPRHLNLTSDEVLLNFGCNVNSDAAYMKQGMRRAGWTDSELSRARREVQKKEDASRRGSSKVSLNAFALVPSFGRSSTSTLSAAPAATAATAGQSRRQ